MKDRKAKSVPIRKRITRRDFLGGAAMATAFAIVPRQVLGGSGNIAPSEKVNVANRQHEATIQRARRPHRRPL